jgi:hypothetical protein
MPNSGAVATTLTTPASAPWSLFAGPYELTSGAVGGPAIDLSSLRFEDTGTSEVGTLEFDVIDMGLASQLVDCMPIRVEDNLTPRTAWTGELVSRAPTVVASGAAIHVTCHDVGLYLDSSLVPSDARQNNSAYFGAGTRLESDRLRIMYLLAIYGSRLSADASQISLYVTKGANGMLPQRWLGLNLRQAAETVASAAGPDILVTTDPSGRLSYRKRLAGSAAPFALRVGNPGGGEMSPENLVIEYDSTQIVNAYYVKGATAAGTGWVLDYASILQYGRHEAFVDAPDADTAAKRDALGAAYLSDNSQPVVRGSFEATSPYDGWVSGQLLTIASAPQFAISSPATYMVASVSWQFMSGAGDRHYNVAFGAAPLSFVRGN